MKQMGRKKGSVAPVLGWTARMYALAAIAVQMVPLRVLPRPYSKAGTGWRGQLREPRASPLSRRPGKQRTPAILAARPACMQFTSLSTLHNVS